MSPRALLIVATAVGLSVAACGGGTKTSGTSSATKYEVKTVADRILTLLPDGAQVVIELDLARMRKNPVVGALVTSILEGDAQVALPDAVPMSPLAKADLVVLASYGVGTSSAAMVVVLSTKEPVASSVPLTDGLVALGPAQWTAQLEARAALAGIDAVNGTSKITASRELLDLRDHAWPAGAPGASIRITARLPFDARVALARATGLEAPPAQISIWADVADDLAIIVDADAADPGDTKQTKGKASASQRLEKSVRGFLIAIGQEPSVKLLGLQPSLENARIVTRSSWLRIIVAVGPDRLNRVVARARTFLDALSNAPDPSVLPPALPSPSVPPGAAS